MVYVTIPSLSSFPSSYKTKDGSLKLDKNDMRSLLPRYSVRECALVRAILIFTCTAIDRLTDQTRFGPARRRD